MLERFEVKPFPPSLLTAAAGNENCGGELVKSFIERGDITSFTKELFIGAIGNSCHGLEVIHLLERNYGRFQKRSC